MRIGLAQHDVHEFHVAGSVHSQTRPAVPLPSVRRLREDLIREEIAEVVDAIWEGDLVALADGIADAIYVLLGTADSFGIDMEPVWNEVQRSNMSKVDPSTGKILRREDGKILKPPTFSPADIKSIIEKQIAKA